VELSAVLYAHAGRDFTVAALTPRGSGTECPVRQPRSMGSRPSSGGIDSNGGLPRWQ
jgi:hypothetical protein